MSGGDFLSRWSRRKRTGAPESDGAPEPAVQETQSAPAAAGLAPPAADPRADVKADDPLAQAEADDPGAHAEAYDAVLARLGLVHPDRMQAGDDFAAFLRAEVPQHLKRLALRRLWRTNPALACVDGLNDYDGDFTGTGVGEGGLRTAYTVGRGFVRALAETSEPTDAPEPAAALVFEGEATGADAPEVAVTDAPEVAVTDAPQVAVADAPEVAVADAPQVAVADAPQVAAVDAASPEGAAEAPSDAPPAGDAPSVAPEPQRFAGDGEAAAPRRRMVFRPAEDGSTKA